MNAMSCKTVSPGSVLIRDKAGEKHSFAGNVTTVEIDAVKDDVVLVEGDCCYELFTEPNGYGNSVHLRYPGEHRLTLEDVSSVFKVGCERRGMHPVLKFFLVSIGIIFLLWMIYHLGKEALFRKRV